MIFHDSNEFLQFFRDLNPDCFAEQPTMREALLIGPEYFRISSQSATDNFYMDPMRIVDPSRALEQHRGLENKLVALGVKVKTFAGLPGMDDAVFPNNAFATTRKNSRPGKQDNHEKHGKLIVGKMLHPVRQREASRMDIRSWFENSLNYEVVDISAMDGVAELTGALVIDHLRGVGFCGLSSRADEAGATAMHAAFNLNAMYVFNLNEAEYHTNVVMTVLAGKATILYPCGLKSAEAAKCIQSCYGANAILISEVEKNEFVANSLSITPDDVLFSKKAYDAMTPRTRGHLEASGLNLHYVDVSEFEKAGGSLRCLIAEIF